MANILVGDIHGCYDPLRLLLDQVKFNPNKDTLWLTGDLVARGSHSLEVLRFAQSLGEKCRISLGNHDIHLLALQADLCKTHLKDKLDKLLSAPDAGELIYWLRTRPLLQHDPRLKLIMVHSGISPQWNLEQTLSCAKEAEMVLRSKKYLSFIKKMYANSPNYWSPNLTGTQRLRYIINAFTRMRYCYNDGRLDFNCKETLDNASPSLTPWFLLKNQLPKDYSVVFGHWAALMGKNIPKPFYGLDTGCCWGGFLTALRFEDKHIFTQNCNNHTN